MPKAIWSGAIGFGLVSIPVKLYSAVEQRDIKFHQLEKSSGKRIRYKRVVGDGHKEVRWENIVKGYELSAGKYVVVTPEELESIEPGRTRTIEIEDFVLLDEIDPIHFESTYYLAPDRGSGAAKAYALLMDAMRSSGRIGIGRFVLRTKQYLAAVRPMDDILALETLYFPDEVREAKAIEGIPVHAKPTPRERTMAKQLVESLASAWDPEKYRDTYRERVLELIERKRKGRGGVVEHPEEEEEAPELPDLMDALRASMEATRKKDRKPRKPRGRRPVRQSGDDGPDARSGAAHRRRGGSGRAGRDGATARRSA